MNRVIVIMFYGTLQSLISLLLTDKFINGFVEDDMVWKGFNADDYKLLAGQRIENPNKYKDSFNKAILIFLLTITIATIFFFKNIANIGGMHISIRYKLVFIFALAVYMPALSLWVLSYTSIHDRRTAIENDTKKGMLEVLIRFSTPPPIEGNSVACFAFSRVRLEASMALSLMTASGKV